ncbi:CPBP family intramembrane glutamic endopeptidase [Corynebacterium minutissimum]|uniref:CPBP family intramembrane glutamic endopeptidase n=1 Tax=Corynebacterium minutissimum TaxID=38301 RepID=UPI001EF22F89|nr:CPBP family intramembrane glutamic endopeptidase [Corynebacterium minutissimum]MCG7230176.1 CPBP family intramembrane metalloprotease [Corynebacterium minutissimum]MCG7239255.1 CPBP family intramembrane metalloprotease [Corynebacterium minutissimum]
MTRSRLRAEILIVLTITFGISGVRAVLRLTDSLLNPAPLNEQSVTINSSQSTTTLLDLAFQLCSTAILIAWGALVLYLLAWPPRLRWRDGLHGAALAAAIGLPGLVLYYAALHWDWTKEVIPGAFDTWIEIPVLLLKSFANAWAEELVVVYWLMSRLKQCGWALPASLAATSLLRGSYHLYQGISAGFGNIVMGLLYGWYFHRTGRVWPLVIAHFLIDAVAFVGYAALFGA